MRILKGLLWTALVLFGLLQLIPMDRDNPPVTADFSEPEDIEHLLRTACYNCHSNETRWPWYAYVAPVSVLVTQDVKGARRDLNFSSWGDLSDIDRGDRYRKIVRRIEKNRMPPPLYKRMHTEARLTKSQRERLIEWAETAGETP